LNFARGEGDIEKGLDEILDFITDIKKRPSYDELFAKGEVIE